MKKFMKNILILIFCLFCFFPISYWAYDPWLWDVETWDVIWWWNQVNNNNALKEVWEDTLFSDFFEIGTSWAVWIKNLIVRIARDLKNIFFAIASIYFLIIVFKLLFTENTEEESEKFKKWILWIMAWIILMQISYSIVRVLFDRWVSEGLASDLISYIINPLIKILETSASFFFIAMAVYAFYKLVTSNWDEEKSSSWKKTIIYAIIWYIVIRFSKLIVDATYWRINCDDTLFWFEDRNNCLDKTNNLWEFSNIIVTIINYLNSFVAIVTIILIIYAWANILLSWWDEEKLKKSKTSIIYIAVWILVLIINYLILTFFILPESVI